MQRWLSVAILAMLSGCQALAPRSGGATHGAGANAQADARLDAALAGEYDNDEQVRQARAGVHAGNKIAVPHLRQQWRLLGHDRGQSLWLWRVQTLDQPGTATTDWLYRIAPAADGTHVVLTPYRAIDPHATSDLADAKKSFKFVPEQWAVLEPCAQTGEWKNAQFSAAADTAACSALLPGLGESAAQLPLRLTLDGDMLNAATFADQARGADAASNLRRLRWFSGWAVINGGGPKARAENSDWHTQNDLRVSSEGGRVRLHWRDGAPSGYSLELVRVTYTERKLRVMQLNVIDDASGQTVDYAWTNPEATAMGINLGWLQVGLSLAPIAQE